MNKFQPFILISRGNEKALSQKLRITALSKVISPPFTILKDKNGKPLVKAQIPVGISISHSENTVAVLITPFEPVGMDLEKIKETYPKRVPDRFFKKSERDKIKASSDFYKIWCKKESFVKMTGEGIGKISSFNSNKTKFKLIDLSEKCSQILGEDFALFVCSNRIFDPEIYVI